LATARRGREERVAFVDVEERECLTWLDLVEKLLGDSTSFLVRPVATVLVPHLLVGPHAHRRPFDRKVHGPNALVRHPVGGPHANLVAVPGKRLNAHLAARRDSRVVHMATALLLFGVDVLMGADVVVGLAPHVPGGVGTDRTVPAVVMPEKANRDVATHILDPLAW
jgi:hypothetical protein